MELSEEFILELTQVQQRLSAFCSSDWLIASKLVKYCSEPIWFSAGRQTTSSWEPISRLGR